MKAQKHYPLPVSLPGNEIHPKSASFLSKLAHYRVLIWAILLFGLLIPKSGIGQLKGTYTIDSTKPASKINYLDMHSAITDLDSGKRQDGGVANGIGVNGPVIFKIADGTYNYGGTPSNPIQLAIYSVPGSSLTNTITFTSASSDSSRVFFSNIILGVVQVHNIVFSNLGFDLKYDGSASFFIEEGSNISITHCLFQTIGTSIGIIKYDTDTTDSISVTHNNFQGSGASIFINYAKNILISDNVISNASAFSGLPNGHLEFFSGFGDRNVIIKDNTFLRNVDTGFSVVAKGFYISNNRILANTGIYVGGEDSTADTIANNTLITHKFGIYDVSYSIGYYENHAILGNNIYTDSAGVSGAGACIYVYNSYAQFNSILDNNIENGPGRAGIYFTSTKVRGTVDYNNYYYKDSFGYFGKKYADFKSFQLATGLEAHGLNLDPQYSMANNLKTGNTNLEGKGVYISGVKYDINGDTRNHVGPTIGAYEISVSDSLNVWPGDANNDGRVDINDLLSVGVAYGKTGPTRANATNTWTPQACNDWSGTFRNGINQKFADCNGNGTIDSNDVSIIALNFTKPHFKALSPASGSPSDPPLTVKFSKDSVQAGDSVTAVISLGSNAINANNVYGVTLSVNYGAFMLNPKRIATDFTKSWLGTIHKNMIALVVNDSVNQILHIGITRTDHNNMSGAGEIGLVSIYMPDNVAGKREVKQYFDMQILDYKSISANEDTILLYPVGDSALVYEYKTADINTRSLKNTSLDVYPNPAKNNIYIKADNTLVKRITITDIMGRTIYTCTNEGALEISVPVSTLSSGVYFMDIMTQNGATRTRFIKE